MTTTNSLKNFSKELERKANQYSLAGGQIKITKKLLEEERRYAEQYKEALLIL